MLPARLTHDGDSRDLAAVPKQKLQVPPSGIFIPTIEIFEDRQNARFRAGIDIRRHGVLRGGKFVFGHSTAEAQQVEVIGFTLNSRRHGG